MAKKPTLKTLLRIATDGDYVGWCIACWKKHYQIEPDARRYTCEKCGQRSVYGIEEIILAH